MKQRLPFPLVVGPHGPRRPLGALRASLVAVAFLAVIAGATPAFADHPREFSRRAQCAQAAEAPVGAVFADALGAKLMTGSPCRFTSLRGGGYRAVGSKWRIRVERPDGSMHVYAPWLGSQPCADAVFEPGDRVEIASNVAIVAGAGIGCSSAR